MINIKIFGMNFAVSVGFVGVLCLMMYIDRAGLVLPTTVAVMLHEGGHLAALFALGSPPKGVTLRVGAVTINGRFDLDGAGELFMFFAGPLANILAAVLCFFVGRFLRSALTFCAVNVIFAVFNLLPVGGLDGGSVFYNIIARWRGRLFASAARNILSVVIAVGIFAFGVWLFFKFGGNPTLILLGIYLLIGILVAKKQKKDL